MKIGMIGAIAAATIAVAGCNEKTATTETKDAAAQYKECKDAATTAAPAKTEQTPATVQAPAVPTDPKEVMISVNGKKLTRGEIDGDVAKFIEARKGQIPAEQVEQAKKYIGEQMAQQFVMKTLLMDEAAKKGVKVTEADRKKQEAEFLKSVAGRPDAPKSFAEMAEKHPFGKERGLKELEESLLIQKLLEQDVTSKIKIDAKKVDEQLKKAADANTEAAKKALDAEAKIKTLAKQLTGLKDDALAKKFAELAKANSDCPSKEKGGDLGAFTHGQMVKEFDEVAFKSEPFTVSAPVKTLFGWHLIMVTKKIPAVAAKGDTPASPEKVQASHILVSARAPQPAPTREQIEKGMKRQEEQQAMRKYFDALRASAKIEAPGYPNLMPKPQPAPAPAAKPIESKPVEVKSAAKPAPATAAKPAEAKK